ncbi:SH3 domain-containing protein [Streptomyces sp. cg35]|uniref:SH3 domain-containing protein n=1 Tax=Streptomyces sp. cg35 TaxID=3421650 RepID=UPI003D175632
MSKDLTRTARIRRAATALALTAGLAASGLVAAGTSEAAAKGCYITAKAASLRSKPSSRSTSVGVVYKGNKCSDRSSAYSGGHSWWKVKMTTGNAKGRTGWIRGDLVHPAAADVPTELH